MRSGRAALNRLQAFAKWYDPDLSMIHFGSWFPKEKPDESTQHDRARVLFDWTKVYDIELGFYGETEAVAVTVAGATFVDKKEDFPSSLLFANVAMAVKSGTAEKRK
jgi:hypothetical protein